MADQASPANPASGEENRPLPIGSEEHDKLTVRGDKILVNEIVF
jgi:hypothetical protein